MSFHPFPMVFLLFGLILGIAVPEVSSFPALSLALTLSGLLAILAILRPNRTGIGVLVCATLAAGASLASAARRECETRAVPQAFTETEGPVSLEGTVATEPQVVDGEMRLDIDSLRITSGGTPALYRGRVRVFVRGNMVEPFSRQPFPMKGDAVQAWIELRDPEPVRSPGGFDQAAWAMREGLDAFGTCKNERLLRILERAPSGPPPIERLRKTLRDSWRHVEDPLNRAVTASMVVGDEGTLDRRTRDDFRAAGLLHLLVVSGSQVAALIFGLRRLMPLSLRISWSGFVIEAVTLISYCAVAGAGDSLIRATLLGLAFALSARIDLHRAGVNCLAGAAVVLLAVRPLDLEDPGAQMSFAAAIALMTLAGPLARLLRSHRVPAVVAEVLAGTIVASCATAPLTVIHFHRLSLIGLPANILAAPLAGFLLYASLLTAVLDAFAAPLAGFSGLICNALAESLRVLAHEASLLDPDWRGPSPPMSIWLAVVLFAVLPGWRRKAVPVACFACALALSGPVRGDGRLHLWFLDVGQGDAILIETPDGRAGMIDTGPSFEGYDAGERVVANALWTLGHRRLEFLAVTHHHSDHEGGAPFLIKHFAPRTIVVNEGSLTLQSFHPQRVVRGFEWVVDGVRFQVLSPETSLSAAAGDENARSLVIEVRFGSTSALLLGDISSEAERQLQTDNPTGFDVVKVAHHGALTSSSEEFTRKARARVALISVGARNRFSHPSAVVVRRWKDSGAMVWRTDRDRTLHIASDGVSVIR